MPAKHLSTAVLIASVLGSVGYVAVAQVDPDPTVEMLPPIEISVDCFSSPEQVKVTNNRAKAITVQRIGSTYNRRNGEPFKPRKKLRPGRSVIYTFGTGDGRGKRLSGSFVFDNHAPAEGVVVRTSKGNVMVRCSEGTNAPPAPGEPGEPGEPTEFHTEPAVTGEAVDTLELLTALRVEPEADAEGYERALFRHWVDADGDGCDTRQEVLIAESLTPAVIGDGCRVERGTWVSAPDGDVLTNPASMDINHVVPLKEAWASGAHAWTSARREAFANELLDARTLQAVSAGANRQQGDSDPASWLPADLEAACRFLADWVAIKASWGLTVDEAERDAIALTLESCGERPVAVTSRETGDD